MRKVTRQAAEAFIAGKSRSIGNTMVVVAEDTVIMLLHGNVIAKRAVDNTKQFEVTLAGWPTPTTKERLNGLLTSYGVSAGFYQRKHVQYYGSTDHSAAIEVDSTAWVHVNTHPVSVDLPELDAFFK